MITPVTRALNFISTRIYVLEEENHAEKKNNYTKSHAFRIKYDLRKYISFVSILQCYSVSMHLLKFFF